MYVLAKFSCTIIIIIQRTFEVTVLQSSSNRKIDLYSNCRENKLQVLTKTDVAYEWSGLQTPNLHHHVHYELKSRLLGTLFILLPCIATNYFEKLNP